VPLFKLSTPVLILVNRNRLGVNLYLKLNMVVSLCLQMSVFLIEKRML